MNKTTKTILWLVLLVILAFYPNIFGVYYTNVFVTFAVFAVYAVALNVLLGFTGLLSFGHAMFFGAGGYGTALALKHIEGLSLFPAIGIGFLSAAVLALILSPLVVRVSGAAFAMLTLAFGQLLYVLTLKLRGITGGEDGIGNFPDARRRQVVGGIQRGLVCIDMSPGLRTAVERVVVLFEQFGD